MLQMQTTQTRWTLIRRSDSIKLGFYFFAQRTGLCINQWIHFVITTDLNLHSQNTISSHQLSPFKLHSIHDWYNIQILDWFEFFKIRRRQLHVPCSWHRIKWPLCATDTRRKNTNAQQARTKGMTCGIKSTYNWAPSLDDAQSHIRNRIDGEMGNLKGEIWNDRRGCGQYRQHDTGKYWFYIWFMLHARICYSIVELKRMQLNTHNQPHTILFLLEKSIVCVTWCCVMPIRCNIPFPYFLGWNWSSRKSQPKISTSIIWNILNAIRFILKSKLARFQWQGILLFTTVLNIHLCMFLLKDIMFQQAKKGQRAHILFLNIILGVF